MGRCRIASPNSGPGVPAGITTDTAKIRTAHTRICSRRGISTAISLRYRCDLPFKKDRGEKEKNMKQACFGITIMAMLCVSVPLVHGQDTSGGEKTFKTKCAGCHGVDAAGKSAVKSPSIKGKSAED